MFTIGIGILSIPSLWYLDGHQLVSWMAWLNIAYEASRYTGNIFGVAFDGGMRRDGVGSTEGPIMHCSRHLNFIYCCEGEGV